MADEPSPAAQIAMNLMKPRPKSLRSSGVALEVRECDKNGHINILNPYHVPEYCMYCVSQMHTILGHIPLEA
jgi:hypothetical protein